MSSSNSQEPHLVGDNELFLANSQALDSLQAYGEDEEQEGNVTITSEGAVSDSANTKTPPEVADSDALNVDEIFAKHQNLVEDCRGEIQTLEAEKEKYRKEHSEKNERYHMEIKEERERVTSRRNADVDKTIKALLSGERAFRTNKSLITGRLERIRERLSVARDSLKDIVGVEDHNTESVKKALQQQKAVLKLEDEFVQVEKKVQQDIAIEDQRFFNEKNAQWNNLQTRLMRLESDYSLYEKAKEEELFRLRKKVGGVASDLAKKRKALKNLESDFFYDTSFDEEYLKNLEEEVTVFEENPPTE